MGKGPKRTQKAAEKGLSSIAAPWNDTAICISLFLLAYTIRLLYLFQIESIPVFYNLPGDPRAYDQWAQAIAAGDWVGNRVFYQAPLYPYFLAVLELIFGHNLWAIRVAQIALGAASAGLLYLAGKAFFSRGVGIASGLIWCFYAPGIFFSGLVDKTVIDPFLIAAILVLFGFAVRRPTRRGGFETGPYADSSTKHSPRTLAIANWPVWIGIGIVLGMLTLSRENTLVWLFFIPLWVWFRFSDEPQLRRLQSLVFFLLGVTLVLLPVGFRNLKVGGQFTLTTSQMGTNFFIGNNPGADGTYGSIRLVTGEKQFEQPEATELAEQAIGHVLMPGEVSRYWLGRAWDYIRSSPGEWLRLIWKKWLIVWNVREIEDSDDFYIYQKWSWLLAFLALITNFGVLAPLATVGIALTLTQWRNLSLLYGMIITFAVSVALFFVFGRYRFPLAPLLSLFAGGAIVETLSLCKTFQPKKFLVSIFVLIVSAVFVYWPVAGKPGPSAPGYTYLANAYAAQGRLDDAIRSAKQALEIDSTYGTAHYNLGNFYAEKNRLDEAIQEYRAAIRVYPRFIEARGNLANVLVMKGDLPGAIEEYRQALLLSPNQSMLHFSLGNVLAMEGRSPEAIEHFDLALKNNPEFPEAHTALAKLLVVEGRRNEGIRHYEEALRLLKARQKGAAQQ